MRKDLTRGGVYRNLVFFSLPYLLACFLQTFYGVADLFIAGQFNGAAIISAVSIGSQVMHMLTVIIVGLAMGTTIVIGRAVGAKNDRALTAAVGTSVLCFAGLSLLLTAVLILGVSPILTLLSTPPEAVAEARRYLLICFAGIPFITAYNVLSSIFRGMGDTKSPMLFVGIAGVINVVMDYLLIGPMRMGAAGAALATVLSQAVSVCFALAAIRRFNLNIALHRRDLRIDRPSLRAIFAIGVPVALQDGFVQIAFLFITVIANQRGVDAAAAVGIVEKIISFLFLVPSAMLSAISAIVAQNAGAGQHRRGRQTLFAAMLIAVGFGLVVSLIVQFQAVPIITLFARSDAAVIAMGADYFQSYVFDCIFAAVHFCFSGYFCAYGKSLLSFVQNAVSVVAVRVPGAYLATRTFPRSLYPMGWAAPLGSLLSAALCVIFFIAFRQYWTRDLPR
jgi:putative MATE family efflux protein